MKEKTHILACPCGHIWSVNLASVLLPVFVPAEHLPHASQKGPLASMDALSATLICLRITNMPAAKAMCWLAFCHARPTVQRVTFARGAKMPLLISVFLHSSGRQLKA